MTSPASFLLPHGGPEELGAWWPLAIIGAVLACIVVALFAGGRPAPHPSRAVRLLSRVPNAMERATRVPGAGWVFCAVGLSMLGLALAGIGFYNDVSWHVDLGRDKTLFTSPHTMIVAGLGTIALSALVGIVCASVTAAPTTLRWRGVRVPWSMLVLGLLGSSALVGFPLDELWHRQYGVDVTMWSPTHLLLILGASFAPIAWLLAIGEAGIRREDGGFAIALRVLSCVFLLLGLASTLGEFEFGVPQFQQLYHPVLIAVVSAFAFVVARMVLGPGRALAVALLALLLRLSDLGGSVRADGHFAPRTAGLFVAGAVAVELAALAGTRRRLRFALVAGVAVGILGLAGEWWWNTGAHQPWGRPLALDALLVGVLGALGAAVLAVAFAAAISRERAAFRAATLAVGAVAVVVSLVLPLPRRVGDVRAKVTLEPVGSEAYVHVEVEPQDAASGARWFQTVAWQGGGLVLSRMVPAGAARYVSDRPVPVSGRWKVLVRLHRGAELMSIPVYLPEDEEIGEPEIPAVDRDTAFVGEARYMLREARPGPPWFAIVAYALIGAITVAWFASMGVAAARMPRSRIVRGARDATTPSTAGRRGLRAAGAGSETR